MNKEKYLELRNGLYTEAENLINEGKLEEGKAKMKEITDLDAKFENEAKELANLNALKDSSKISNIAPVVKENKIGSIDSEGIKESMTDSIEYRKAFMNYIVSGKPMPESLKNNTVTTGGALAPVIPDTLHGKIIEAIEAQGMILPLITRTNYKGGVSIPLDSVKPTAEWLGEGVKPSGTPIKKAITSIVFAYHKLKCTISMTLEASVVTLPMFEAMFVRQVSEAMVKALENAIVNGTGVNSPKGILIADNVTAAKARTLAVKNADSVNYKTLTEAEGLLPLEYENDAVWFMSKKTFMKFIGMVDSAGQPVARVNYGITGVPERTLLGRRVILNNYIPTTKNASLTTGGVLAFLVNPADYILNTNLELTLTRYENHDTDDQLMKCVGLFDGQLVVKESLVIIEDQSLTQA